jgi:glutathione synthase/RimK-type ligase-like ATP-grasp enzyme
MQVLVLTHSQDPIDRTLAAIARRATVVRLDSDRLATDAGFTMVQEAHGSVATVRTPEGTVTLDALRAVWLRRFAEPRLPDALPAHVQQGIRQETRAALLGWLAALPAPTMDPRALRKDPERKALTLRIAAEEGLAVPRTLHTTRIDAARAFVASCPAGAITKVLTSFALQREGQEQVVFTNPVTLADLDRMGDLRWCPMTLQERIPKVRELRVTIVGPHILACEADTAHIAGAELDFRRAGRKVAPHWRPTTLPADVQDRLLRTMARMGLNYGAADVLVDPEGRHVLLEINASGEYLLYDHVNDGAISEAIAAHLVEQVGWRAPIVER